MHHERYHEQVIMGLIFVLTLFLHLCMLLALFIFTRRQDMRPLRLTPHHPIIEYALSTLPQHPSAVQPSVIQHDAPEVPEDGQDRYTVQNALSSGSYTQGSIVMPEGNGIEHDEQQYAQQKPQTKQNKSEPSSEQEQQDTPKSSTVKTQIESSTQGQTSPTTRDHGQEPTQQSAYDELQDLVNNSGTAWASPRACHPQEYAPGTTSENATASKTDPVEQQAPKKQLTLADITRGYIKQVRQEQESTSNYTYNSTGNTTQTQHGVYAPPTNGVALAEQIYASKLYSLLEQSALAYSSQIYSCKDLDMETVIEVTIEKSGKILDVTLKPELPEKEIQNALCLIVKRVGLFPPIPRQFRKQRIILSIPLRIKSKQGFASYRLLYGIHTA